MYYLFPGIYTYTSLFPGIYTYTSCFARQL